MNVARVAILVFAIGATVLLMQAQQPAPEPRPPAKIAVPTGGPLHGVALQVNWSQGALKTYLPMIDEIAALGADTVAFSTAAYQTHAGSPDLAIDPKRTATPEQWGTMFTAARKRGLRILLMPIVLLSEPRGTEWRGVIQPPDWDAWFAQYRQVILHFAKLAGEHKVEVLKIGSELVSTETFTGQWRRIIREVREVYPQPGKLSYSANWDHYRKIEFWDELDLVGMTTYHQLSEKPAPALQTLVDAWKPIKDEILAWQRTAGKPIIFTEVGWCSQEGCAVEAWNYYRQDVATSAGMAEQLRCYEAFCRTWADTPGVGGVIWWEWTPRSGTADFGYTPKGKPAERILREWFRDRRRARTDQPPPAAGQ